MSALLLRPEVLIRVMVGISKNVRHFSIRYNCVVATIYVETCTKILPVVTKCYACQEVLCTSLVPRLLRSGT